MARTVPRKDADLFDWSANFSRVLDESAEAYGFTAAQAARYAERHLAFAEAYRRVADPTTATRGMVAEKNARRAALEPLAAEYARIARCQTAVTDQQLIALGLRPRRPRRRVPRPGTAPGVAVVSVDRLTVELRLRDRESDRRGRPVGTVGAEVFYHVGPEAPSDVRQWVFAGRTSKVVARVSFPPTPRTGAKVWLTARWINARGETSDAATPVYTHLPYGGAARPTDGLVALRWARAA